MKVTLYEMQGCHFCKKAIDMFADQLSDGRLEIDQATNCPKEHRPRGFPFFVHADTGSTHTGLPSSWDELMDKLGVDTGGQGGGQDGDQDGGQDGGQDGAHVVTWLMPGCPWCTKFKQEMKDLIAKEIVKVVQHDDDNFPPPKGVSGFPFSMNLRTGAKANGFMPLEKAVAALDIPVEGFLVAPLKTEEHSHPDPRTGTPNTHSHPNGAKAHSHGVQTPHPHPHPHPHGIQTPHPHPHGVQTPHGVRHPHPGGGSTQQHRGPGGLPGPPAGPSTGIPSFTPPPAAQPGVHFMKIPGVSEPLPYVYWPQYGAYPFLSYAWDDFGAFGVL